MSKQYRYEKFEKLSDAVKAWESGEQLYLDAGNGFELLKLHEGTTHFWTIIDCYRRVEVKPLELELFKQDGILGMLKINGEYYSVYPLKEPLPNNYPKMRGYESSVKMREVIE